MTTPDGQAVTRDGARDEARRELSRAVYGDHQPGWFRRAVEWINHELGVVFSWVDPTPRGGHGSYTGLGVFAGVLALAVVAVVLRVWLGPVRRSARSRREETDLASPLSAAGLRAQAEAEARDGRHAEAVRSRMRAVVRMLEEKGVLDPLPSRTAGELVLELEARGTAGMDELRQAVTVFSDIWYGGRGAGADDYALVVRADDTLARARGAGAGAAGPTFAVPS